MAIVNFDKIINYLKPVKKFSINERTLRSEGIKVLIDDERWIRLFSSIKKSPSILKAEEEIRTLIEEKTRLHMENNMLQAEKQAEKSVSEERLIEIYERERMIEKRNDELEAEINSRNFVLLDNAVTYLYRNMIKSQKRTVELDSQIKKMRNTLKNRIDERGALEASVNETYNFLHGLLGAKQIESIDIHYTLD